MPNVTPAELDAILISELLTSVDRVLIGANLPAPRAGALLAALTHAPGLRVCQGLGWMDPRDRAEPRPPRPGMDVRDAEGSEALLLDDEAYDDVRRLSTLFVIGGFEIDATGATNLLGERRNGRWVRRGAGAIGTTSMAILAARTIVYATRHDTAGVRRALRRGLGARMERRTRSGALSLARRCLRLRGPGSPDAPAAYAPGLDA